jgi:hypothetical protein
MAKKRALKKCRDPQCGATDPRSFRMTVDQLPPDVASLVTAYGLQDGVARCGYCSSISSGDEVIGHRAGLATSEMVWDIKERK